MSFFSPAALGRPKAAARKPGAAPEEASAGKPQVMAVLTAIFNVMALNGVLVISCLPLITAPAALQAATVAIDRWQNEGDDRVVRQFILALRSRRFWHTTLTVGVPLVAAALAATEVLFFSRAATAGNGVGVGLGIAGLLLALSSSGFVLALGAQQPDLPSTDAWFLAVSLVARNLLVASPLLAGELIAGSLLLLRDPALAVIGAPVGVLALASRTARRGIERAQDLIDFDIETLDDREVDQ
jgi:hypothetical protein